MAERQYSFAIWKHCQQKGDHTRLNAIGLKAILLLCFLCGKRNKVLLKQQSDREKQKDKEIIDNHISCLKDQKENWDIRREILTCKIADTAKSTLYHVLANLYKWSEKSNSCLCSQFHYYYSPPVLLPLCSVTAGLIAWGQAPIYETAQH